MGVSPLQWSEIESFCRLTHFTLMQWELTAIESVDDLYLAEQSKKMKSDLENAKHARTKG